MERFYLESDLLIWDGAEETLTSPGPVFILWEGLEIQAAEMVMEAQSSLLYLKDDVRIRDGSMLWRLEQAVYDLEQKLMDFYGRVVLEGEDGDDE
jgi:lipopolysaccharide assembly outer membrane protein LptD (OstA)